ncbi:MAG: phosphatase PAP2 family protein [Terracoccus sp.]
MNVKRREDDGDPRPRHGHHRVAGPRWWAAAAAALSLMALYAASRRSTVGWSLDVRLQLRLLDSSPAVTDLARHLLALVNPITFLALTCGLTVVAWHRTGRRAGVDVVLGVGTALVLAESGKALLPTATHPQGGGLGLAGTFPSGHLAVTSGLVLAALAVLPAGRPRLAPWVGGAVVVMAAAVAVVVVGWHRPSDAVAGVLVAVLAHHGVRAAARHAHGPSTGPPTAPASVRSSQDVQAH